MGDIVHHTWIDTDDTGFQAVCSNCTWCGPWHREGDLAVEDPLEEAQDDAAYHGVIIDWFST